MLSLPTARLEVDNVATPEVKVTTPSVLVPSMNLTVPVGVPVTETGDTVAVRVTDCPYSDGLAEDVRLVEEAGSALMDSVNGLAVLAS
jgi:hypothetical protein